MLPINQLTGTHFEWRQPEPFRRFYELVGDEQPLASLRFEKACGTLATAEWHRPPRLHMTFKRSGFWSPKVTVRDVGSEIDLAVFAPRWSSGGELAFSDGRKFLLKSTNFWGGEWAFETQQRDEVVSVRGPHGLVRHSGQVSLGLTAANISETPILLLLIWYLRILMQDDAAAAG